MVTNAFVVFSIIYIYHIYDYFVFDRVAKARCLMCVNVDLNIVVSDTDHIRRF